MRSAIVGMGTMFVFIIIFVICTTIQMNANIYVEVSEAANEAAYLSMLSLTERDEISNDEQLEQDFVRNANLILQGVEIGTGPGQSYYNSQMFEHSKNE